MTPWQRRARAAVALGGLGFGVIVYLGVAERQTAPVSALGQPLAAGVAGACTGGEQQKWSGAREDYLVESASCLFFEDGRTELVDVRITSKDRDGRDFVITGGKLFAGKDNDNLQLEGGVTLRDSTGFELRTDKGTFQRGEGVLRTDGAVAFSKARMTGSGTGMVYEEHTDVLRLAKEAVVDLAETGDAAGMRFTSGSAVLDRRQDFLLLEGGVHSLQGEQTTDADRSLVRLTPDEDLVTFVELRGNAQVAGGEGPLQGMRAKDIDLDYSDNGQYVERAVLAGSGSIVLQGADGQRGRDFSGDRLDLAIAEDGSVTRIQGDGSVAMSLPASPDVPGRVIRARSVLATGDVGGTITHARFSDNVEFREAARGEADERVARSKTLTLEMAEEAVSSALFQGGTTFEEGDLKATAPEARYAPDRETLRLTGRDAGGRPRAADATVTIDADAIDIALHDRRIEATTGIKTTIRPSSANRGRGRGGVAAASPRQETRLPGLLAQDKPASVTAETRLLYEGASGNASYSGRVVLWQDETEVRGDTLDIRQDSGDLVARGSARSTMRLDGGATEGEGHEIRYIDKDRVVTYTAPAAPAAAKGAPAAGARVRGPQGDLRAGNRIEVYLADGESKVEKLEAYTAVTGSVEDVTMTGHRLTYRAAEDQYDVVGTNTSLARADVSCQRFAGNTLTFSRSADTIRVDGGQRFRTQTERKSQC